MLKNNCVIRFCRWLYQHRPVSRKRYENMELAYEIERCKTNGGAIKLKPGDVIEVNGKPWVVGRIDFDQPRDPATGKFCKRGG